MVVHPSDQGAAVFENVLKRSLQVAGAVRGEGPPFRAVTVEAVQERGVGGVVEDAGDDGQGDDGKDKDLEASGLKNAAAAGRLAGGPGRGQPECGRKREHYFV